MNDFRTKSLKPKRSLQSVFILWLLVFALLPLFFITGYSLKSFEEAIDRELGHRLLANAREIISIFDDIEKHQSTNLKNYIENLRLKRYLESNDVRGMETLVRRWMSEQVSGRILLFSRHGHLLVAGYRSGQGEILTDFGYRQTPTPTLSGRYLEDLRQEKIQKKIDDTAKGRLELVASGVVQGAKGVPLGYIELVTVLDQDFFGSLSDRLGLEIFIVNKAGMVKLTTQEDVSFYSPPFFEERIHGQESNFWTMPIRGQSHAFLVDRLPWGDSFIYQGLISSKKRTYAVIQQVRSTFLWVVIVVVVLLLVGSVLISRNILKPYYSLVGAMKELKDAKAPQPLEITSDTEIGLLIRQFNEMSEQIHHMQEELRKKVKELETANQTLKETQAQLVHSAKMVSLGQLVAGIAHELNNPIGFIFSNMAPLRESIGELKNLIQDLEKQLPSKEAQKLKSQFEYDYLAEDLEKIVDACEEGARRSRDIVVGLRNFSRLDEAEVKTIRLDEAIETTLKLLGGELKDERVRIHKDYQGSPLEISCYASQINQVLMNVLSNAVQAIEGQGNIWIEAGRNTLDSGEPGVFLKIRDDGCGMSEEVQNKIFDPFFTTKQVGKGTGLGLSITHGIIEKHGGTLAVHSDEGKGTEFVIELPALLR